MKHCWVVKKIIGDNDQASLYIARSDVADFEAMEIICNPNSSVEINPPKDFPKLVTWEAVSGWF